MNGNSFSDSLHKSVDGILPEIARLKSETDTAIYDSIVKEFTGLKDVFKAVKWFKFFDVSAALMKYFAKLYELKIEPNRIQDDIEEILLFLNELKQIREENSEAGVYNHNKLRLKYQLYDFSKIPSPADIKKEEKPKQKIMDDPAVVKMVKTELSELVDSLENHYNELARNPGNEEKIRTIFRVIHTIKGNSATIGFTALNKIAHEFEFMLGRIRDKHLNVSDAVLSLCYSSMDFFKALLNAPEINDSAFMKSYDSILHSIQDIVSGKSINSSVETVSIQSVNAVSSAQSESILRVPMHRIDSVINWSGELHLALLQTREDIKKLEALNKELKKLKESYSSFDENYIRLDSVADKYNEITSSIEKRYNLTTQIGYEIRTRLMDVRMVTLKGLFDRFPRIVRDTAKSLNKEVDLEISGSEMNVDKKILEELSDPMMHIIRNAVDHGIDLPEERKKKNKSSKGHLSVKAERHGSEIIITVSDDGEGFNIEKIKAKAVEKKLAAEDDVKLMNPDEVVQLIFLPGFSTKDTVTDISGRGVGLDVVMQNVQKLKGTVRAYANKAGGSSFEIKVPLSLATEQVLYIESSGQKYAVPMNQIRKMDKISGDLLEKIGSNISYFTEGSYFSVKFLNTMLDSSSVITDSSEDRIISVLVMKYYPVAFIVDKILKKEEIVVKSLPENLDSLDYFSGVTIDMNGKPVLILNIPRLVKL